MNDAMFDIDDHYYCRLDGCDGEGSQAAKLGCDGEQWWVAGWVLGGSLGGFICGLGYLDEGRW